MPRQLNPASSLPAEPCGSPPPASSRAPHAVRGHQLIPMPRSRLRRGSRLCFSRDTSVGDGCERGRAGAPCTSDESVGVCSVSSWAMVRAGDELVRSLHRGAGKPSIPADTSAVGREVSRAALHCFVGTGADGPCPSPRPRARGVTQGLPLPLSPHPRGRLAQAGRKASLRLAELPCLTRRPNQASARRLRFVRQYLISASLTRRPLPGEASKGRVCMRRTQTDSSREAPVNHSPFQPVTSK